MRLFAPAALAAGCLLVAASASADVGAEAAAAAPVPAAPPAAPVAPAYPAPLPYQPGAAPPYMMYSLAGAGAPPPYWMPMAPPTERRSESMRTTGIVLFAAGGLISAVGGVIFGVVESTRCVDEVFVNGGADSGPTPAASRERVRSSHQALNGCDTSPVVGLSIITAGVLTAVVGIPLFVIGSKQVPARTTTGKLVPELTVGPANGTLRWAF